MSAPEYDPKPIDASKVTLGDDLVALTEKLAENTHDLWARERMAQGWRWGPERNDSRKEHPSLIPYADLSDDEKKFDRETAMGTLKAMMALGYEVRSSVRPAASTGSTGQSAAVLEPWTMALDQHFAKATGDSDGTSRNWTFDMDDAPEIASLPTGRCHIAREALEFLQQHVRTEWKRADKEALRQQAWHRIVATAAIAAGIVAILCAIVQLVMQTRFLQTKDAAWHGYLKHVEHLEMAAILIAAIALVGGLFMHLHHGWLGSRQRAERLRVLKFRSLAWRELWCDMEAWKRRVLASLESLKTLDSHGAKKWAHEEETSPDYLDELKDCVTPEEDVAALEALYHTKRLRFQEHYFQFQSAKASPRSRIADWKLGLWLFGISALVVLIHQLLMHQSEPGRPSGGLDIWLIGLAALLPVIGFGLRAWLAAFETPRSRNLFRAKARALEYFIQNRPSGGSPVDSFRRVVADGEDVFTNEHREWCRLQMEAEWFV